MPHLKIEITEEHVREAIRLLDAVFEDEFVLKVENKTWLTAMAHTSFTAIKARESGRRHVKTGTIEYRISDGPPGKRGNSCDFFNYEEALKFYETTRRDGWNAARSEARRVEPLGVPAS